MVLLLKSSLDQNLVSKEGCQRIGTLPGDLITNILVFYEIQKCMLQHFGTVQYQTLCRKSYPDWKRSVTSLIPCC